MFLNTEAKETGSSMVMKVLWSYENKFKVSFCSHILWRSSFMELVFLKLCKKMQRSYFENHVWPSSAQAQAQLSCLRLVLKSSGQVTPQCSRTKIERLSKLVLQLEDKLNFFFKWKTNFLLTEDDNYFWKMEEDFDF